MNPIVPVRRPVLVDLAEAGAHDPQEGDSVVLDPEVRLLLDQEHPVGVHHPDPVRDSAAVGDRADRDVLECGDVIAGLEPGAEDHTVDELLGGARLPDLTGGHAAEVDLRVEEVEAARCPSPTTARSELLTDLAVHRVSIPTHPAATFGPGRTAANRSAPTPRPRPRRSSGRARCRRRRRDSSSVGIVLASSAHTLVRKARADPDSRCEIRYREHGRGDIEAADDDLGFRDGRLDEVEIVGGLENSSEHEPADARA